MSSKFVDGVKIELTPEDEARVADRLPTPEEQVIIDAALDRIAELDAELASSAFKGYSLTEAKAYSDATAIDLPGIQKVLRKIIGAVMALHPQELE